ncbi:MAG: site-specific tyrosine recombinase XerD [Acidimicrobiaceae bacterium]|nr:site-specific tyrosine recombinase XerD [Acidimicrobiaceae bacterium]
MNTYQDSSSSQAAEAFLVWLTVERGRSANTLEAYKHDLRSYYNYLQRHERNPLNATTRDVLSFVSELRVAGLSRSSVARVLSTVRGLHRFCVSEGIRNEDPTIGVKIPKLTSKLPKALSVDQVTTLITAIDGDCMVNRRDRAILEVLYGTGCRVSELTAMSVSDLDLREGLVRVTGKGSKERIVPLGRHAILALERWLHPAGRDRMKPKQWARRGDAQAVFLNQRGGRISRQGIWLIVVHYGELTGLSEVLTPHVLRHSCATHMLNGGADIRFVQELLGHASISTTQIYTTVSTERLWNVYRSAHPRASGAE